MSCAVAIPDPHPEQTPGPPPGQASAHGGGPAVGGAGGRRRYQPRQRSRWERIPLALRIGAPAVLAALAWFVWWRWPPTHAVLAFVNEAGPVSRLELTLFPDDVGFHLPSPPPPLGRLEVEGIGEVELDDDLVPGTAFVRYAGPGIGTGYTRVEIGRKARPVVLRPPVVLAGRAGVPEGLYAFGLRGVGLQPVAGARVVCLGGGEHGVVLCETTTDAEGRFELMGLDAGLDALGIRVLAPGHALAFVRWSKGLPAPTVPLVPTRPLRGRVVLPEGLPPDFEPARLRVLARGLPGVQAEPRADGSFELDHVTPGQHPRLLLFGLPPSLTHHEVRGSAGDSDVRIVAEPAATIRGHVLHRGSQRRMAGAVVWHRHGPVGQVAVEADRGGAFELPAVPAGEIELRASLRERDESDKLVERSGVRTVRVEPGVDIDDIIIRIE